MAEAPWRQVLLQCTSSSETQAGNSVFLENNLLNCFLGGALLSRGQEAPKLDVMCIYSVKQTAVNHIQYNQCSLILNPECIF